MKYVIEPFEFDGVELAAEYIAENFAAADFGKWHEENCPDIPAADVIDDYLAFTLEEATSDLRAMQAGDTCEILGFPVSATLDD